MKMDIKTDGAAQINVAATFDRDAVSHYNRADVQEYVESRLDTNDILYASVITLELDGGNFTVQCKLHKAAISKRAVDDVAEMFEAMDGHIETWILTESVMKHPEIYK